VKKEGITTALLDFQLAEILLDQGNVDDSIQLFSRSLRIYLGHFGKDSLNVAEALCGMGKAFSRNSRFQKALRCFDKAMRVYEFKEKLAPREKLGDLHQEIGHNMMLLEGDMYEVLEHYRSAVSFLEVANADNEINDKLVVVYSEMLGIMRDVLDAENDEITQMELLDELGDVLHRLGNLHASCGEHKKALACFTEVLDIQQKRHTGREEIRIADLLFNMGNIYVELKQPDKAIQCLEKSYGITKDALGKNHKELHSTMYLIGIASYELNDLDESLKWFTKALSVLDANADNEEVDNAAKGRTLYRLGQIYEETGNNSKALSCFQEMKSIQSNGIEMSNALYSMGNLLQQKGDYENALHCYDQSLRGHTASGDHLVIARTKESIGLAFSSLGEPDRSLSYLAAALRLSFVGSLSFDTGKMLMNIGQVYLTQGICYTARNYFEAALDIFEGESSRLLDIAVCLYCIGVIQEESSEDGSLDNYLRAIQIFKSENANTSAASIATGLQKYDVIMANCLHQAAKSYVRDNNYASALEYMNEAFDIRKERFGVDHAETTDSQHWLGIIHLALGEDELALSQFKRALKGRVALFGTEHHDVAETLYGLAEVHFKRDELPECLECINENLRLYSTQLKCDNKMISRSKLMLGSCYQELGRYDEAKEQLSEALQLLVTVHGKQQHLDVADAHFRLGICDCETNDLDESIEHFKTAALMRSALLGDLDIECANTYESLGIVQQKKLAHNDAVSSFEKALAIKRASLPEVDEDIAVIQHFIGTSLFEIEKYDEALHFFSNSSDIKKTLYGSHDQEYAMALLDKAAALAKIGENRLSMECYSELIESGGLPLDSWELGIAYKSLANYFYERGEINSSFDSYSEAVSIFEWIMETERPPAFKYDYVIECYVRLLEMQDDLLSEERGLTCYKLANCYVQACKLQGKKTIALELALFNRLT
jgi:tetratricopeptide (TPR) repeat protein